jgi:hypothetical protein
MNSIKCLILPSMALSILAASAAYAQTKAQLATAVKLGLVHTGFTFLGFSKSNDYLWNWQLANGTAKQFPASQLSSDVLLHLQKQQQDIIGSVNRGIKNGTIKPNSTVRITAANRSMPRPDRRTDFTYAIGGCTISSYADVAVGKADAKGKIVCKISGWSSTLSDIYKFDKSDSFNLANYAFFPAGELYDFEKAGLAKQFSVTTGGFFYASLLVSFNSSK